VAAARRMDSSNNTKICLHLSCAAVVTCQLSHTVLENLIAHWAAVLPHCMHGASWAVHGAQEIQKLPNVNRLG